MKKFIYLILLVLFLVPFISSGADNCLKNFKQCKEKNSRKEVCTQDFLNCNKTYKECLSKCPTVPDPKQCKTQKCTNNPSNVCISNCDKETED